MNVKNSILITIADYSAFGVLLLTNVIINNYFGLSILGQFTLILSTAQVLTLGLGGAFSIMLRKYLLVDNADEQPIFSSIVNLRVLTSILLFLPLFYLIFLKFFGDVTITSILLIFLAKCVDLINDTFFVYYQSKGDYGKFFLIKIFHSFILCATVFLFAKYNDDISFVYLSFLVSSVIILVINIIRFNKGIKFDLFINEEKIRIITDSWPLVINSIVFQLSSRINVFLVSKLLNDLVLGLMTTAIASVTIFTAASNSIGIVLFAYLSSAFIKGAKHFIYFFRKVISISAIFSSFIYLFFLILLPVIFYFFQNLPEISKDFFVIIGISIPFTILTGLVGNTLVILNEQKFSMYISIIMLIMSIFIYFFSIKYWGELGCAYAFLISSMVQFVLIYFAVEYKVSSLINLEEVNY